MVSVTNRADIDYVASIVRRNKPSEVHVHVQNTNVVRHLWRLGTLECVHTLCIYICTRRCILGLSHLFPLGTKLCAHLKILRVQFHALGVYSFPR